MRSRLLLLALVCLLALPVLAVEADKQDAKGKEKDPFVSGTFSGLKFRSIGPAYCSGRIGDLAVNPNKPSEYYVAVASGHVWKTVNAGTTWTPVFDKHGAYSIGCVAMDPANSNVVWIGTGENNHQRSVSYGDGVYKSVDGGKSWKHMGLKESRHIGMIAIDPRDSRVVFVAAEGSAWGPGGDRGLYKTEDGGATWTKALEISENTGVNNVVLDPRCPDRIYATSEQRRAHVYTKIGGGPETAIHKSEDGGKTWRKLTSGLPAGHMGGIGLAVSPVNPDVIYAMIEAANDESGFYRSTDRGESWSKMSDHASSGQYYNEIYCDPKNVDKVYSVETFSFVTVDGGKTWQRLSNNGRHVDDHVIWIDPADTDHFLIGGDGGLYESWDAGATYEFKHNLPVTQFYRVNVDNSLPFYYVFGGTQDNNSMGGPSRTTSSQGIVNADWFVTQGGDGFWTAVDPTNPNIVYAEAQYGNMCRYDRQSGESVDIRPEPRPGEKTYRWFWDTPLMISPHAPARLYCAANKVFRSDDRGDTWTVISDDLTAQIDRNTIPVMGKFWSVDAVAKDVSLSQYGVILAMDESPVRENLLYVGTDDGLIQISEDARTWRKAGDFPGVPANTYVSDVQADRFNEQVVYAAFDNHKRDDFKPYLLKSADKGKTWTSIAGNLPERGTVYTVAQDHVNPDLLFAGTEFGVFFTVDGGRKWVQLTGDLPTVAVFDIAIQRRENDLVLATFGRGFYILDDYSALRQVTPEMLQADARLFPARDALMYIQSRGLSSQGSSYYSAKNPPFGATFTYYLKDAPKTRRQIRQEKEAELFKEGKPIPQPSVDELRAEEREEKPHLLFTIADAAGQVVRTIATRAGKGFNRVTWDLRYAPTTPVQLKDNKFDPLAESRGGVLAMPGPYTVSLALVTDGQPKPLAGPVPFGAVVLNNATLPAPDRAELVAFQKQAAELARTMMGSERLADEMFKRLAHIRQALAATPAAPAALTERARTLALELDQVLFTFRGQEAKASAEEIPPAPVPLNDRLSAMTYSMWRSTSKPTGTARTAYEILQKEFPTVLQAITRIHQTDLPQLEREVEAAGAPWTPGRLPVLK